MIDGQVIENLFDKYLGIDWTNIRKSPAPYIPEQAHELDMSNFQRESNKVAEDKELEPFSAKKQNTESDQINPEKFRFTRLDILHEENERIVEEAQATNIKIEDDEIFALRREAMDKRRKWTVFDDYDSPAQDNVKVSSKN